MIIKCLLYDENLAPVGKSRQSVLIKSATGKKTCLLHVNFDKVKLFLQFIRELVFSYATFNFDTYNFVSEKKV